MKVDIPYRTIHGSHGHPIVNYISARLLHSNVPLVSFGVYLSPILQKKNKSLEKSIGSVFLVPFYCFIHRSRLGLDSSVIRAAIAKP